MLSLILSAIMQLSARAEELNTKQAPQLQPVSAADILEIVKGHDSGPVLVNIWATWCQPCCEEMPDLLRLRSEFMDRGFKLVLVSADFARESQTAENFLGSLGVNFESYIKNQQDEEFINQIDPNWSGALPFSILFGAEANVIQTWDGKLTYEEVSKLLTDLE